MCVGSFFFVGKQHGVAHDNIVEISRRQFQAAGFAKPHTFEYADFLIDYYAKIDSATADYLDLDGGDFAFSVGTFIYRGRIGAAALALFVREPDPATAIADTHGHFVIVLRRGGEVTLWRDPAASFELYHHPDLRCVSTSFLALARTAASRTLNLQEMYEYVFHGVTLGTETLLAEVRRLDIGERMRLSPRPAILHQPVELCPPERDAPVGELVEANLEELLAYTKELVGIFGDNIRHALSGGYDSRLLLALFRHSGITPHLFVYGSEHDPDVQIARRITTGEGISLSHVDKAKLRVVTPDSFPAIVADTFDRDEGAPSFGIFHSGAEHCARRLRREGGALHVNGGGGEVFRNFFNLLDRPLSSRGFVWTFYSQFDPADTTDRFDVRAYTDAVAGKVNRLLGVTQEPLSRRQVESLYPYLRCRSWFAPENSINNRYGHSVLPFFDHRIVTRALQVPIRHKHFGGFESALIRRADPALAAYASVYGHSFSRPAPLRARGRAMLDYLRPVALRRHTFRVKAHLGGRPVRPALLEPACLQQVLPRGLARLSRYFNPDRMVSELQFARLCTLEYLLERLGVDDPS
jgi:asparagine synthase (glutamine-hydrolysing)